MNFFRPTILSLSILLISACGGSGTSATAPAGKTAFALTDAPKDDLSIIQINVDQLDIRDSLQNTTRIFPTNGAPPLTVNLLQLQSSHILLGNLNLANSNFDQLILRYSRALVVDKAGNSLSVNSGHSGTLTIAFQPPLQLGTRNSLIELDFDVNSSVSNLTLGPGGSLDINPTLVAKVQGQSGQSLDDLEGIVRVVGSKSLTLALGLSLVNLELTPNTIIRAKGFRFTLNSPNFVLAKAIPVASIVEVDGTFDPLSNSVTATRIELEDGLSGLTGDTYRGLLVGLSKGHFTVLVLESQLPSTPPGTSVIANYNASTQFEFDDPAGPSTSADLSLGQKVRVTSDKSDPSQAIEVKLKETKIRGLVRGIDSTARTAHVTLSRVENLSISSIPAFNPDIVVQFSSIPATVTSKVTVDLEGHFGRGAGGTFLISDSHSLSPDEDEIEGRTFFMLQTQPFSLSITGQLETNQAKSTTTVEVVLAAGAVLVEKNQALMSTTTLSEKAFSSRLGSGAYTIIEAEGRYDASSNTLTATKLEGKRP